MIKELSSVVGAIPPHGGKLINRLAGQEEALEMSAKAKEFGQVRISPRVASDAYMIGVGGFSPLTGFMNSRDYNSVVGSMHLENGLPWAIPVTVSSEPEEATVLKEGQRVALIDENDGLVAVLDLEEKFEYEVEKEASEVYRTTESSHPGVAAIYRQGPILLAGPITLVNPVPPTAVPHYALEPAQTRKLFDDKDWRTVVGFQTRNPVHRAHEYIQKCAMEIVDGLLLHPLVGETKSDDIPAEVRMECYRVLLDNYYPEDRTVLSVLPAAMRYAGPREAIFHALVRKNYGCTHFIVGRDHAGVGNYYGTYDAQHIFSEFDPDKFGIRPMFFENSFYCRRCKSMATAKTCPHGPEDHQSLSGTQVRELLSRGEPLPEEYSRPEVARVLTDASQGN